MSEHHWKALESCINPRSREDDLLGNTLADVMSNLEEPSLNLCRHQLRRCFTRYELWIVQAVCYRNKNPAFRPMLDKWQAILDAIQANPEILQRCIDKARAKPDSLP